MHAAILQDPRVGSYRMTAVSVWGGSMNVFGIDVGGSGIKGAPVDTQSGELLEERVRIKTPEPATPEAIIETVVEVVREAGWEGPVGCGFPAVVKDGVVQTAANIDKAAIGFDLNEALQRELGLPVSVVNDADAAGLAEIRWGAGRDEDGVVLMLTLGTGIGTSLVIGGGISKKSEKFFPHLTARTKIVPAEMHNNAGIAGAALAGIPERAAVKTVEQ